MSRQQELKKEEAESAVQQRIPKRTLPPLTLPRKRPSLVSSAAQSVAKHLVKSGVEKPLRADEAEKMCADVCVMLGFPDDAKVEAARIMCTKVQTAA